MIRWKSGIDLRPILKGRVLVSSGIGPADDLVMLVVDPEHAEVPFGRDEQPGWASFPKSKVESPYPATVIKVGSSGQSQESPTVLSLAYMHVQPLPDGETLVVGARCRRFPDGTAEENGLVLDRDGQLLRTFVLGDGIQDVQVDHSGQLWVSYFDEGIFGNYGWDDPIGSSGLVRFDAEGRQTWSFKAPPGFDSMADCYALNVGSDSVWVCYYTDFPVVRLSLDGSVVEGWSNSSLPGASALVFQGDRLLLAGGYEYGAALMELRTFEGRRFTRLLEEVDEDGMSLPAPGGFLKGRGARLHWPTPNHWFWYDLE